MTKFGIGVGEEFPVDDARPRDPEASECRGGHGHGRWRGRGHFIGHVLARIAFLALIVLGIFWLSHQFGSEFHGPYAFHPGHHHFFFPVLLLVLLAAFAWRRHRHHHHHGHWHGHHHHDRGEGA